MDLRNHIQEPCDRTTPEEKDKSSLCFTRHLNSLKVQYQEKYYQDNCNDTGIDTTQVNPKLAEKNLKIVCKSKRLTSTDSNY